MDKDFKKLITFYIGTFDKNTHKQELSIDYFKEILDETFDCYTLSKCYGRYKHNDGTVVNELTLKVEYLDINNTLNVQKTCDEFKQLFNQECIMVTCTEIDVAFI